MKIRAACGTLLSMCTSHAQSMLASLLGARQQHRHTYTMASSFAASFGDIGPVLLTAYHSHLPVTAVLRPDGATIELLGEAVRPRCLLYLL